MFIKLLFSDPRLFLSLALVVIFSICVHEFMHAYIALKNGDPTAADAGHLTVNPFKQMGWRSLIMLCLIGIAWGQVPVNRANLSSRRARVAVALAGVGANLLLSIFFTILTVVILKYFPQEKFAQGVFLFGAVINLVLFAINLFPVPGFDGWNLLNEFWRPKVTSEWVNGAFFVIIILLFFSIDYIQLAATFLVKLNIVLWLEILK